MHFMLLVHSICVRVPVPVYKRQLCTGYRALDTAILKTTLMIFLTTCIDREVFSFVMMGTRPVLPVFQCLGEGIAFDF